VLLLRRGLTVGIRKIALVGVQNSNGDAVSYAYDADGVRS
jgi:hypothetical protein